MEPKTREEHYLAKIAGEDVTIPEPKTRTEHYLNDIAENGMGYKVSEYTKFFIPEQHNVLLHEEVVDVDDLSYIFYSAELEPADGLLMKDLPDELTVEIDGRIFTETKVDKGKVVSYGMSEIGFTEDHPFNIGFIVGRDGLCDRAIFKCKYGSVESFKAYTRLKDVESSDDFAYAVHDAMEPLTLKVEMPKDPESGTPAYIDKTKKETIKAINDGRQIYVSIGNKSMLVSVEKQNELGEVVLTANDFTAGNTEFWLYFYGLLICEHSNLQVNRCKIIPEYSSDAKVFDIEFKSEDPSIPDEETPEETPSAQ